MVLVAERAEPRMAPRARPQSQLWRPDFRPAAMRWWHATIKRHYVKDDLDDIGHIDLLRKMIAGAGSTEDAVALDFCFRRCVDDGARSASGLWCVCLKETPPPAAEVRGHMSGGSTVEAWVAVLADLNHAADSLPIGWSSTAAVFAAQGRTAVYDARFLYYRRNVGVRLIDTWVEPRDPDSGRPQSRQMCWFLMSRAVGGVRKTCDFVESNGRMIHNAARHEHFGSRLAA